MIDVYETELTLTQREHLHQRYLEMLQQPDNRETALGFLRYVTGLLRGEYLAEASIFFDGGEAVEAPENQNEDIDAVAYTMLVALIKEIAELPDEVFKDSEHENDLFFFPNWVVNRFLSGSEFIDLPWEIVDQLDDVCFEWDQYNSYEWDSSLVFWEKIANILTQHPSEKLSAEWIGLFNFLMEEKLSTIDEVTARFKEIKEAAEERGVLVFETGADDFISLVYQRIVGLYDEYVLEREEATITGEAVGKNTPDAIADLD